MKSSKLSSIWKNLRPAIIVFALIIVVIIAHMFMRPSKIDSIEQNQYKDKIQVSTIKTLKSTVHLHQMKHHHDRYTGIINHLVSQGSYRNVKFAADYYKSRNILDLTPLNKSVNYKLCREPKTRNKAAIRNATYVADSILAYDASLRKQVNDPYLGVQLTAHSPHHQIPVLFSVNDSSVRYKVLKVKNLKLPSKGLFS